ncbi:D-3-phosphoglycerate dehydrogenase [Amycolatopsis arida]|uniref:D-3-phosphoglycerate dehydrogenase n=1 Tax=Amycolatopsis arida TaxID=587909 RepID=A0A1I5V9I0_9PSEU|nr:NAD(P)-dependent oxidoreductase [Amycolatopsis arida]TDX91198.1 D-3-phosphoglycerate dehydrogenase [Amycolatopsis arida]SFQ04145.1 D-3-phosphoglycerate dehydrogenase [Amycolatopsis arida]
MTARILAAGDQFVRPELLVGALRRELGEGPEITTLELPWPVRPFGRVAEVDEASGDEEEMIAALRGVRVCVTQLAPLTERVLAACPDLELFAVGRGGPVNANLAAAAAHGVAVTAAPGRNASATAEHTVAMLLAAARRVPHTDRELRQGVWRGDYYRYDEVGIELDGACAGLVGYGAVGRRVARILRGFGARVVVHDPFVPAESIEADEVVELAELLGRADVVSLHARLTPETAGLLGAAEIAAMRPGAILVNCARGGLLDYDAVCDALDAGHLFAAAFDVFPEEPLPADSRLPRTPGVVLTPHLAGASKQTAHAAARIVAAEAGRHLRGEPLAHRVN